MSQGIRLPFLNLDTPSNQFLNYQSLEKQGFSPKTMNDLQLKMIKEKIQKGKIHDFLALESKGRNNNNQPKEIINELLPNLTIARIDLRNNRINDAGATHIVSFIQKNNPQVYSFKRQSN